MQVIKISKAVFAFTILLWGFAAITASAVFAEENRTLELGKIVYEKHCVICHGEKGDGKGAFFAVVQEASLASGIYPRDFTIGVFRFRSTSTGCLPANDDLRRIISSGILRSHMPSHPDLPEAEATAVIEYVKTFFAEWGQMEPCKPIIAKKPAWLGMPDSVKKGEKLWKDMKCWECHGDMGKGDGPKSNQLKDDWGKQIVPYDFTSGAAKRGDAPEDIYLAYTTGLDGSGMPSYEDSMSDEDRWHLVSYTLKLMGLVK
ncbi:MAG: cytochrome c [Nitrospirae bacterium]|nr:cytochrome c [Nitrospirota bacterium]